MTDLQILIDHVESTGIKVVTGGEMNCYMGCMSKIIVEDSDDTLITLLHEAGHAEQGDIENRYMKVDPDDSPRKEKLFVKLRYENEEDAWNRGERLGHDLNLDVDWNAFNTIRQKCLVTYEKL